MQLKKGLGRGIESLIPPAPIKLVSDLPQAVNKLPLSSIIPNRLQPRVIFDDEKIRELSSSIVEQGIIQPIVVTPLGNGRYEIVAGERRFRAARLAGLEEVPVVVKKVDDQERLELSIIENIQREDLNPLEESRAYSELIKQFGLTQEEVAQKVGKSRVAVANSIRLQNLPKVVQDDISSGRYSAGHGRAILAIDGIHEQLKIRERILKEMPTVRDVEKMVQSLQNGATKGRKRSALLSPLTPQLGVLADTMKASMGTKVSIHPKGKGGSIIIEYYSSQDLDRIYRRIIA